MPDACPNPAFLCIILRDDRGGPREVSAVDAVPDACAKIFAMRARSRKKRVLLIPLKQEDRVPSAVRPEGRLRGGFMNRLGQATPFDESAVLLGAAIGFFRFRGASIR